MRCHLVVPPFHVTQDQGGALKPSGGGEHVGGVIFHPPSELIHTCSHFVMIASIPTLSTRPSFEAPLTSWLS